MSKNLNPRIKVSFSEYFNPEGKIVKEEGESIEGEVLLFHNMTYGNGSERVASVNCVDSELYFVPFDSLIFLKEKE